jgi:hypothetical protein
MVIGINLNTKSDFIKVMVVPPQRIIHKVIFTSTSSEVHIFQPTFQKHFQMATLKQTKSTANALKELRTEAERLHHQR